MGLNVPRGKRVTVYVVTSKQHGACYLRSMRAALDHHVRYTLRVEQEDSVRITRKQVGMAFLMSLDTCEHTGEES